MNEGWATFWHYTILNHLYDEGKVSERFMMEFLHSHTNVVFQPAYNSPWYSGINPYALGFAMFRISSVFVSRPPKRTNTGSRILPVPTGWKRCTSRCVILRMRALSASSCRRRSCVISASSPYWMMTATTSRDLRDPQRRGLSRDPLAPVVPVQSE